MPDPNYVSEIEREDGTILTIKDAEARAAISDMDPTLQQILQGVNDIKSSIGDVGEIVEEVLVGPPTLIEKTITENGTYNASDDDADGYSSVTVDVAGGGGGGTDVIFYDYDGSVVASYSAADFANLSAMPANPTHEGLTAQGWNWSLADAKAYVASYGKLNIGQMYITYDGVTRFYHTATPLNKTVTLYLTLADNTELDIEWGDDSHTSWTSADGDTSKEYTYTYTGNFITSITVISGSYRVDYADMILHKVEIGSNVTAISNFHDEMSLKTITIPRGVLSIGENLCYYCIGLSAIIIPDTVVSIPLSAFEDCIALKVMSMPKSITSVGDGAFKNCCGITSITLSDQVTSLGENAFSSCNGLSLLNIPSSVTSIGASAFSQVYACYYITFYSSTPATAVGNLEIENPCIIRVPQGSLSAYTSAQNYPNPEYHIYEEY